ncbi:MAG: NAD(P)-binding domain-containing protein, partial [Clostridia bacterium]|nr:NAD(P)-binding domain-containing protein [Clostridia bacterium]
MREPDLRKVTIIGAGNVGATIAYTLAIEGIANEILMIDIKADKAEGEAMDITQGSPFFKGARVTSGDYKDAVNSDIVIITSGVARSAGQNRLDLAQVNVDILKRIAKDITAYAPDAIYILISNPVDVLTYAFNKITNIPESRIIGSGTILDTSRLRSYLGDHFHISRQNVHAFVFGEHGDSSFVPWSQVNISCVDVEKYREVSVEDTEPIPPLNRADAENYVRTSGSQIIARKGATYYAVSTAAVHICKCIFSGNDTAMTISSMHHNEYGIDDVCLST